MHTRLASVISRVLLALVVSLSAAGISTQEARATSYPVSNLNNSGDGSLRQAITNANLNAGADTINFSVSGTINLASGLTITDDLIIDGSEQDVTISGGGATWVMNINGGNDVTLNELNISNGTYSGGDGGGIWVNTSTLTVMDCTFSQNSAGWGGAIRNQSGTLNVRESTFSDNSSPNGGAIYSTNGTVKVLNSTFSGNGSTGNGAGIHAVDSTLEVTNSSFSDNSAASSGGAIYARQGTGTSTVTVSNSTFSANTAPTHGAGIYNETGSLSLRNVILANSTAGEDCYSNVAPVSYTNNLIENNSNCGAIFDSSDPMLAPLANNGGSTRTFGLLVGSPAIDAGNPSVCSSSPVSNLDQRGVVRPVGAKCDIGALEAKNENGSMTLRSEGTRDGWILESSETSSNGGTLDRTSTTFNLGDGLSDKQYRAILSFDTSVLPNNAIITKVTLKIKKQGTVGGGNPVTTFQGFKVDIKKGTFGTAVLQIGDFQAAASKSYGPFTPSLVSNWYSINLTSGKAYINKLATAGGLTQIRLRFKLDDNNNSIANYLILYSGNSGTVAFRPQLIIEYYVP